MLLRNDSLEQFLCNNFWKLLQHLFSIRGSSLQCCCHCCVPFCKKASQGVCFVKWLLCTFHDINCAKTFLCKEFFWIILAAKVSDIFKRYWNFQAGHAPNAYFLWGGGTSEGQDWNFQARLNLLSEIAKFKRDLFFRSLGPEGRMMLN